MNSGSVRLLIALVVVCAIGGSAYVGWTIWQQTETHTAAQTIAATENQNPELQQAETSAPDMGSSNSSGSSLTQTEQTAELTSIGNALDEYQSQVGFYPESVETLEEEDPQVQVSQSYSYGVDAPVSPDIYALCTVMVDHINYQCISSELGSTDPFTFPVDSSEMYDFSKWYWIELTSTSSEEENVEIPLPPDWKYATSTYTADLDGVDSQGKNVIIGRINTQNWQMTPGESFAQFEQTISANPDWEIASSTLTAISGFPTYVLTGEHTEGNIHYYFLTDLIQQNTYVFEINMFIDETVSSYFDQTLPAISSSIRLVPSSGN